MKKSVSFALLLVFVFHSLAAAQIRNRPAPRVTAPVSKFDPDKTSAGKPDDTANDFAEKGLPPPDDYGGAPNDELAAALARELSDYEKDNLPLLMTALQRAGFFIINDKQKTLYQPTSGTGMGLAFYDFEVAGMYKLSRRGIVSSVEKMAAKMGKETPELPPARIAELMLRDLKTAANSSNRAVRFWARLIVELGKNSSVPVDLLATNSPSAPINIIQASLWERRLIGDIIAFAEQNSARNFRLAPPKNSNRVEFLNASYSPVFAAPCQTTEVEGLVMDAASLGITTAHGQFLDAVKDTLSTKGQETLGKISNGLFLVNLALGWAKLAAALTSIKAEMKIADPMPLERTKNADEGQTRLMTARLWTEVGNKQFLNCVRLAMNTATGLDFSMPNEGPLAQRDVSWELTGAASFAGQGSSKSGKFDNFVNLKAPEGADRDPSKQISDDNGESQMNIVGAPKIPTVINKPVVPVRKKAKVKVSVALKAKKDFEQNFIDLGGAVIGTLMGGALGVLGSLPEIGFRMKFDVRNLTVPVKDWELCTADWAGTIDYLRVFKTAYSVNSGGRKGTRTIDERTEATFVLNPRSREMPPDTPPLPADAYVSVKNSDIFEGTGEADVCCNNKEAKDAGARIREKIEVEMDTQTKAKVDINLSGNFLLSIFPTFLDYSVFVGTKRRSFTVSESACPVDEDQTAESTTEENVNMLLDGLRDTKTNRRLSNTGEGVEELTGTETFDHPRGGTVTYIWSLARCGK